MSCKVHDSHNHTHGSGCGHIAIKHDGHTDYLHDNHMHHVHDGHVDEHSLSINQDNAAGCTPAHSCKGHAKTHTHASDCGHASVPHGDHIDYLVDGHLHSPHHEHCDDHGTIQLI
jgi:hypothetical protein